jgi:GNAT superfamily N-acetyltransferase
MLTNSVRFSPLDEARFGVRTARAMDVTADQLPEILEFCNDQEVQFLIARCSTREFATLQAMERAGFLIMDTLVYFYFDVLRKTLPERHQVSIRTIRPQHDDIEAIADVARQAFRGYESHYHADLRLDRSACDDLYVDWAVRSCTQKDLADEVLVAEANNEVFGFLALKSIENNEADCRLYAVSQRTQQKGIGQALLIEALYWCKSNGLNALMISTQITNIASQKSCVRVGFEPYSSFHTFHKWFSTGGKQ